MSKKTKIESLPIDETTRVLIQTTAIEAKHKGEGDELVGLEEELDLRLGQAIDRLRPAAAAVFESLRKLNSPKQIELEFGIGVSGSLGAFIASSEAEVNFKVKLLWENPAAGPSDAG